MAGESAPDSSAPASASASASAPDTQINAGHAINYWTGIESTVEGMLGGFPQVSRIDLQSSSIFLAKLRRKFGARGSGAAARGETNGVRSDGRKRDVDGNEKRVRIGGGVGDGMENIQGQGQAQGQAKEIEREAETEKEKEREKEKAHEENKEKEKLPLVLECGAGIGRITLGFLVHASQKIDIVEPIPKFTQQLQINARAAGHEQAIGSIYNTGLESFAPEPGKKYDLIWHQWCLGQLTDAAFVAWLQRCTDALAEGGWIVIKENLSTNGDGSDEFDETDSSVTRSEGKWETLFREAGLKTVSKERQRGFPVELGLLPVCCWALRPVA